MNRLLEINGYDNTQLVGQIYKQMIINSNFGNDRKYYLPLSQGDMSDSDVTTAVNAVKKMLKNFRIYSNLCIVFSAYPI